ncbi:MAG: PKD domain-containing protein, partial [Methanoregula sp.]|nr:PKD domain-containing protein [Methanoregula sp.]
MKSRHHESQKIRFVLALLVTSALFFGFCAAAEEAVGTITQADRDVLARNIVADNSLASQFLYKGELIDERVIGPGLPPADWKANENLADVTGRTAGKFRVTDVPTLDWSYGCSATSATMYFGYYDRNGYPNFYTGPTDSGVFPLTNAIWGAGECPLSASHKGIDGRTPNGSVDDYWFAYDSKIDPYYGSWTEHTPKDCLGDYMGTNQYQNWQNTDGGTTFFYYTSGSPTIDYTGSETSRQRDGAHGMKLFVESLGYEIQTKGNYNQYIYGYNGNTRGFTYDQYKAEIDAGNPVIIQLDGHTMLGVGYTPGTSTIIIHDTWDYSSHTMTWGGAYSGMTHYGVTVIKLKGITPHVNFTANMTYGPVPLAVKFTDTSDMSPTGWNWSFGDGNFSVLQNPEFTYTVPGNYPVSLNVSNAYGSNTTTRTGYINAIPPAPPVANFTVNITNGPVPLTISFTDTSPGYPFAGNPTAWNWS